METLYSHSGYFTLYPAARGVNGLYIYSTVTMDRCWICDSPPAVFQRFFNSLEINVKTNTVFLKLLKFVNIVLVEYFIFYQYSKDILPFESIH